MAKIDKILGSVSPLYGAVSGQGLYGKGFDALGAQAGLAGVLASEKRRKRKADGTEDSTPAMRKGGEVKSIKDAVHKHERNMHKGKPLTKMAKGGAAKRADGIAKKGRTKGRMR